MNVWPERGQPEREEAGLWGWVASIALLTAGILASVWLVGVITSPDNRPPQVIEELDMDSDEICAKCGHSINSSAHYMCCIDPTPWDGEPEK